MQEVMMTERSDQLRTFYARYVALCAGTGDPRIEAAFAAVKREDFLGPGPWFLPGGVDAMGAGRGYFQSPDADLAFIYQDVLVALDPARGLNNGEPSLHARCLDAAAVQDGEAVLHVGAGTGYYSAILAQLAGQRGRVHAYEIDPELAARAAQNLARLDNVGLRAESGVAADLPKVNAIYVNAGTTQPAWVWLDALQPGGRLLFPLQQEGGFGAMLLVTKPVDGGLAWPARFVCRCGFVPLAGRQDDALGRELTRAFRGNWQHVRTLRLDGKPDETCWVSGGDWWLSTDGISD
jgi:protein-L-isoaspartate(D-aspartate) O-methyltransferase